MGEVLGQIFVKEYFPEKTKKRYVDLVEAVRTSFKEHIDKLDWMSAETKQKGYYKLRKSNALKLASRINGGIFHRWR
jgi:putative endopeptidase